MKQFAELLRPFSTRLVMAAGFLLLVAIAACVGPQAPPISGPIGATIAAPGMLTSADEKALYALEAQLNRLAAVAKVAAPALSPDERALRAAQLEDGWDKLRDLRCLHRAANGLPIAPADAERCGRAVTIHGTDPRQLMAEAGAIARGLETALGGK